MNKNRIKAYAPTARKELMAAVAAKAQILGLSDQKVEPVEVKGDVAIIGGRPFPRTVAGLRRNLEVALKREGFGQLVERIAFTWFNRFTALRYMELHGFLDHGFRVLSHPNGGSIPEILEHATDLDLPGLDKAKVAELRIAGNRDAELYRLLLVAQCNALNSALPFLFERTNDETELLLPDNLLHSDSPLRKLVDEIDEADWKEVEIIGWLYQFYISEKKDSVIGKIVKSEDIPAATQLFTPNWIVKYLVQNTLGRQWLATYPQSPLRGKMEFYIEPAEQTANVKAQLKQITPAELNPETITLFDPACGSGHILVEAYDLFKQIYEERGYARRDIPRMILEKNLFGLDIDERAAQFASFALMMKARADDRGLFRANPPVRLNVMAIQETNGLDFEEISHGLLKEKMVKLIEQESPVQIELPGTLGKPQQPVLSVTQKPNLGKETIHAFLKVFENAKTFGSLIRVPDEMAKVLPTLEKLIDPNIGKDLPGMVSANILSPVVGQAKILTKVYDHVVANPPYMGNKYLNPLLKDYLRKNYKGFDKDLFSSFIVRNFSFVGDHGLLGFMSPVVWMFITTFEGMRNLILGEKNLLSLVQPELHSFFDSAFVSICAFILRNTHTQETGTFFRLTDFYGAEIQEMKFKEAIINSNCPWKFSVCPDEFRMIPGSPIAYWVSGNVRRIFSRGIPFKNIGFPKVGMQTSNNDRFLRFWYEISHVEFMEPLSSERPPKWIKYLKGGAFRRWYGNLSYLLRYNRNPEFITQQENATILPESRLHDPKCTWTDLTSGSFSARIAPEDSFHDISGHCFYPSRADQLSLLGYANTKQFDFFMSLVNSTFHFQVGDVGRMPVLEFPKDAVTKIVEQLVYISKMDWDSKEISWDFARHQMLCEDIRQTNLESTFRFFRKQKMIQIAEMKRLEEENNQIFITAYGLEKEILPEISEDRISLWCNPKFCFGGSLSDEEYQQRFCSDSLKELLSYAVGCMMGRYSLDIPGLIFANAGNEGFDHSQYKEFPADDDGIVPVSDIDWFADDATPRLVEFIKKVFGAEALDENLAWIATSFEPKRGESAIDTIRRYFSTKFFKDHMQMYKKRPIYWLFSSGKQKAFEALVYLHRYNESTLSRMRAQYVTPLQGKLNARIEHLRREIDGAGSAAAKTKLRKEVEILVKKQNELAKFDEELRHYADQRIKLDLDDGVKVNYGKFGALLAETKAITGGDDE